MFKLEDLFSAYYDCRKNKRGTASAIEFELDYDANCIQLWRELNDRVYLPTKSIAFIVLKPRRREIFAANFRDRVLHHLVDSKLRPLLENDLIDKTFNNRKGKGVAACIKSLQRDIKEASENYTDDCWVSKMDMSGFFMSISKSLLTQMIGAYIDDHYFEDDKDDLQWLVSVIINDHPEEHCFLKSNWKEWEKLDRNKSLFWSDKDLGIPIGNLISQLLANFYLNNFDHYVKDFLGFEFYGRYVDDFYLVSKDKEKILHSIPLIRTKLQEVGITLHPHKFYLQHYTKGIELVGAVIKPGRTYLHNRTVNNAFRAVESLIRLRQPSLHVENAVSQINSYLGFMKAHSSYAIRRNLIASIDQKWWKFMYVSGSHEKVSAINKYKRREIIKQILTNKNVTHCRLVNI